MKDYLKEFKKQKLRKNVVIAMSSLAFAFAINGFLFVTPAGVKLQSSVQNYAGNKPQTEAKSDLYLVNGGTGADMIDIRIGSTLKKVSEIRLSIVSDVSALKINDIFSEDKDYHVVKTTNVPGYYFVTIKLGTPQDIKPESNIAKIVYTKKGEQKTSVNLAETTFISDGTSYDLQNSGVEF